MTLTGLAIRNLRRNVTRTVLTISAFALPIAVFVIAISFVARLVAQGAEAQTQLRLAVHHKTTLTNLLPEGMRSRIEQLDEGQDRLVAVCGMRWFGGRIPNSNEPTLTSLAADPDTLPEVYKDAGMTPEDIALWNRDRRSCAVGEEIASRYGWKVGGKVTLASTIPPYLQLEFIVSKIMTNTTTRNAFYFRRDFLEESLKEAGPTTPGCNVFWVKCRTVDDMRALQNEIDAYFANDENQTKSEDENAFFANFAQAAGDVIGLMRVMAMVVVFVIALAAGNTMMMSFRERTRELAVLKALGFPARRIFAMVLGESVLIAMIGAGFGISFVTLAVKLIRTDDLVAMGPFRGLTVSVFGVAGAAIIALVVGFTAGLWPAWRATRIETVTALRHVA